MFAGVLSASCWHCATHRGPARDNSGLLPLRVVTSRNLLFHRSAHVLSAVAMRARNHVGLAGPASARERYRQVRVLGDRIRCWAPDSLLLCISMAGGRCLPGDKPRKTQAVASGGVYARGGGFDPSLVFQSARESRRVAGYKGLVELAAMAFQSHGRHVPTRSPVF